MSLSEPCASIFKPPDIGTCARRHIRTSIEPPERSGNQTAKSTTRLLTDYPHGIQQDCGVSGEKREAAHTMAPSALDQERELAINPIVGSSVQHNTQVVSNIRSLTASLFGVAAGTLGLESYAGFIFYLLGSLVVSVLLFALKTDGKPGAYFYRPLGDLWLGDVLGGLSGFVLTWTLFYGLVRA